MSREAMKLALEALEGNCTNAAADPEQAANEDAAITALRQALNTERQWVGLTDDEIEDIYFDKFSMSELEDFARSIEQALKEKNKW